LGNGGEQFFFQSETLCGGNPYNASHAATEPVQIDQGMHQGYGR
jgi:hypothetical protein